MTRAALPAAEDRGPSCPSRSATDGPARRTGPLLAHGAALHCVALRFVCCARARSLPRPPAMPGAGPPERKVCSGRLDRRASRFASCHVGRGAASPRERVRAARGVRRASKLSRRPRLLGPSMPRSLHVAPVSPTAIPPTAPPSPSEGDLWGDLQCGGPGNRLAVSCVGSRTNSHPTPRPPLKRGGSEESQAEGSVFSSQGGCGWSFR